MKRVALLLSLLALHCASNEEQPRARGRRAPGETTEPELKSDGEPQNAEGPAAPAPPPKPDPILSFTFNEQNVTIHARVKVEAKDAALFVDVFTLKHGQDSPVDCDSVKSLGRPVDLREARAAGKYVIADVPFDLDVSQRLDGTERTAIHGCLIDGAGKVVAQYATSLMNAWDTDEATAAATPRVFHGIEAYASSCIDELGELPMFEGGKDFDCTKDPGMRVIPITADGAERTTATTRCDRPAWLGYESSAAAQCAPFSRIGRYTNSKGTRFVVICRREAARGLMDPNFENINFIAHNPKSGKTCFMNNHLDETSMDGTRIPPPNTPTADRFWMDMGSMKGQRCPSCHDSDPWLHSPWIDQALDAQGHTIVPRIGEDPEHTTTSKYSIFARESFAGPDAESREGWKAPQHVANVGACGSCHRIGAAMSLEAWSQRSVGEPEDWQSSLTASFRTFTKLHWMPTTPMTEAQWMGSPNEQSMRQINACARNPGSCSVVDVPH